METCCSCFFFCVYVMMSVILIFPSCMFWSVCSILGMNSCCCSCALVIIAWLVHLGVIVVFVLAAPPQEEHDVFIAVVFAGLHGAALALLMVFCISGILCCFLNMGIIGA